MMILFRLYQASLCLQLHSASTRAGFGLSTVTNSLLRHFEQSDENRILIGIILLPSAYTVLS